MRPGLDAVGVPGGFEAPGSTAGEGARWRVDRLGGARRRVILDRDARGVVIHDAPPPELRTRTAIDAEPDDVTKIDAAAVAAKM